MRKRWMTPLLQVDGDIGAPSGDQSSVETGADALDTGIAPESGQGNEQPDVTNQESFATRLRERTEQIEQQYAPYKQHVTQLEQIAQGLGFSTVEDYITAANADLQARKAAEESQRLGVDQETYNQFFAPVHTELQQTKAELQRLRQADIDRQVRADYERLKAQHPDFTSVQDQVFELAGKRGLPLEDAYKLATWETRITAAAQEAEQNVLANVTGRDSKQVLPGRDKGGGVKFDPANMSLKDIEALSARVQAGERIEL